MPTSEALHIAPELQPHYTELFTQLAQVDYRSGAYQRQSGEGTTPLQVFLAPTPEVALQWICNQVPQHRLLAYIAAQYPSTSSETGDGEDGAADEDIERYPRESGTPDARSAAEENPTLRVQKSSRKRGPTKETTAKQANKRLKEKLENAMLHEVASTQDWVSAKRKEITVNDEEMRYHRFAQKFQGAGIALVGSMINKAASIGTLECLKEWRTLLSVWRAQHQDGRLLFTGVDSKLPGLTEYEDSGSDTNIDPYRIRPVQRREDRVAQDPAQLSEQEMDEFAEMFLTARRSRTAGIIGDMRHRWIMAAMYTRYEALVALVRKRQDSTGGRGRGFATVAKERLFQRIYKRPSENSPSPKANPVEWKAFSTELESGRRWCMLKAKFGLGIFALLPRSVISNNFIERGLTIMRFGQWIEMVATCNTTVAELADAVEGVFVACMMDCAPPKRMLLEDLTDEELEQFDALTAFSEVECELEEERWGQLRIQETQLVAEE